MNAPNFLVVKLAAAGDVLLTTALTRALRRAYPESSIGWLTSGYAAELLEGNPDLSQVIAVPVPVAGIAARSRAALRWQLLLRRWQQEHGDATVLLGHRSRGLTLLLRAAGFRRIVGFRQAPDHCRTRSGALPAETHRLEVQADLLRAAGIPIAGLSLAPRLLLAPSEIAAGEQMWAASPGPRWALAPGGAANPWSAMPTRRWAPQRFVALARRARTAGVAVRWLGGAADAAITRWIAAQFPAGDADNYAGHLSLRHTAAVCAAADLVIGNDSLPLVMAHALGRPGLGLYGPTAGRSIHAPGQPYVQGIAGCGPCYNPHHGTHGQAYRCARARCMEQIEVEEVWRLARGASGAHGEVMHA